MELLGYTEGVQSGLVADRVAGVRREELLAVGTRAAVNVAILRTDQVAVGKKLNDQPHSHVCDFALHAMARKVGLETQEMCIRAQ